MTAPLELGGLWDIADHLEEIPWQPFHDGVDIHRLYGDGLSGPSAALLRFRRRAAVPFHHHEGYEHILVLAGCQSDEHGPLPAGTLRIHPPGSGHRPIGEAGCVVLAIYEKPVRFGPPPAIPASTPAAAALGSALDDVEGTRLGQGHGNGVRRLPRQGLGAGPPDP